MTEYTVERCESAIRACIALSVGGQTRHEKHHWDRCADEWYRRLHVAVAEAAFQGARSDR